MLHEDDHDEATCDCSVCTERRAHQLTGDGVIDGEEDEAEEEVSDGVDARKTLSVIKELQPVLQRYLAADEDFVLEEECPKTWRHDRKLESFMVD